MKIQNIDLSSLTSNGNQRQKENLIDKIPKWAKWLIASLLLLLIALLVLYSVSSPSEQKKPVQPKLPSPKPEVTLSPTLDEKTKKEKIREKWNQAKQDLDENNYNNELLLPPQVELDLQLEK